MATITRFAAAAGGGASQPSSPSVNVSLSGTGGSISVTDDNATLGQTYTATPSTGSATMTGTSGTLSGQTPQPQSADGQPTTYGYSSVAVTRTSRKGGLTAQTTKNITRAGYTTYYWQGNCCGWSGPDEFGWYYCNCYTGGGWLRNPTPSGYSDSGSDWYMVS